MSNRNYERFTDPIVFTEGVVKNEEVDRTHPDYRLGYKAFAVEGLPQDFSKSLQWNQGYNQARVDNQ